MTQTDKERLVEEIYKWVSEIRWPPNRTQFRRALVRLGEPNIWNIPSMTLSEAIRIRDSKPIDKRDYPRWSRIVNMIDAEQHPHKPQTIPKHADDIERAKLGISTQSKSAAETIVFTKNDALHIMQGGYFHPATPIGSEFIIKFDKDVQNMLTKGAHTPDTDPRAVATLKREIKNKDELIAQKRREYNDLLNKNRGNAQTQSLVIHERDTMINEQKKIIKQLESDMQDMRLTYGATSSQKMLKAAVARLEADKIGIKANAEKYMKRAEEWQRKYEEQLVQNAELRSDTETVKLEQEIAELKHKLNNATSTNKMIDFQTAISGLMSGRVLEPEMKTQITLSDQDLYDLRNFKDDWHRALKSLPDTYAYGMKNKESGICKRHEIKINDYGQPVCSRFNTDGFARTLQYLDNAIAHAHQEIQAAARVADMLIKAGAK